MYVNQKFSYSHVVVNTKRKIILSLFFLMYSSACVYRIGILLVSHLLHHINVPPFHNECF